MPRTGGSIDLVVWDYEFDVDGVQQLIAFVVGLLLLAGSAVYLYRERERDRRKTRSSSASRLSCDFSSTARARRRCGSASGSTSASNGCRRAGTSSMTRHGGMATRSAGYWQAAVAVPAPEQAEQGARARITYDGWREFIQYMLDNEWYEWFNWVIILGEIAIGLGLILGAFTGIAAFFGATLNMSFLCPGRHRRTRCC